MNSTPLIRWITSVLVCLMIYVFYSASGTLVLKIAQWQEWNMDTIRLVYRYLGVLVYSLIPVYWCLIGHHLAVYESPAKRLKMAGLLLMMEGVMGLGWQAVVFVGMILSKSLISVEMVVVNTCLSAVITIMAFIWLAIRYADRKMIGWGIGYAISELGFAIAFSYYRLTPDHNIGAICFALFSFGVVLCEVVYLLRWRKILRLEIEKNA